MKTVRILAVLLAVTLITALAGPVPTNAKGTKTVNFSGSYSGTSTLLINGTNVKIVSIKGTGSGSLVGHSSVTGTGTATGQGSACVPFKGTGSIVGSAATIKFSVSMSNSQGCTNSQTGPATVTVTGKAKVTSGTGKAKGAKGTLSFSGKLKLKGTTGTQTGTFNGKLTGKLTVSK